MNATEKMNDLQATSQHLVERYKNSVISTMLLFFKRMEKLVLKEIGGEYQDKGFTIQEKNALKKKMKTIQEIELNKIHDNIMKDSYKLLGEQAKTYEKQLRMVLEDVSEFIKVNSVSEKVLKKNYQKERIIFDDGKSYTLDSWWKSFFNRVNETLIQNLESAHSLQKSKKDYEKDLKSNYKVNENQLKALISVFIQQAYSSAIRSVNNNNLVFLSGYLWNSILDRQTSDICRSLAFKTYFYEKPELSTLPYEIYPPAHARCRSFTSPIIKTYQELGIASGNLSASQKETLSTSPINTTYAKWFEKQTNSTKREILGNARYESYKNGKLDVTAFYTNDGRKLTLKELQNKQIQISEEYLRYIK